MDLLLATETGFIRAQGNGDQWQVVGEGLPGRSLTSIIAREGVILAGATDGIFRSHDLGETWREANQGLAHRHARWLAYHPQISDLEFVGTEPAGIFVSQDGGESWTERPKVGELRDQFGWWLPYSPQAGCVRGFAFHGSRVYAAVEVGGVLRSDDYGESWQLAAGSDGRPRFGPPQDGFVHPDVHDVFVHPSSPDLLFAPTGGGFYRSRNGGESWECLHADSYVRAVWVDADDPHHIILGPADGPSGHNGRILVSNDSGQSWTLQHRLERGMVQRFRQINHTLFAVTSAGHLLAKWEGETEWQRILPHLPHVEAIDSMA